MKNHQVMVLLSMCLILMIVACQTSSIDLIENLNTLFSSKEMTILDFTNLSPDGRYFAQINQDDQIVIRSALTKEIIGKSNFAIIPMHEIYIVNWSPDSSMLMVFSGKPPLLLNADRIIILKLLENNTLLEKTYKLSRQVYPSVSWSPDSKKIVVSEEDKIYVINSEAELLFYFNNLPAYCNWVEWGNNGIYAGFDNSDPELGMLVFILGDGINNSHELLFTSEYGYVWPISDSVEKNSTLFIWLQDRSHGFAYFLVNLDEDHSITELTIESKVPLIDSVSLSDFVVNDKYQYYAIESNDEWYVFSWDDMEFIYCGLSNYKAFKYIPYLDGFLVINGREDNTEPFTIDFVKCQP